jgi:hypothetical protein
LHYIPDFQFQHFWSFGFGDTRAAHVMMWALRPLRSSSFPPWKSTGDHPLSALCFFPLFLTYDQVH